MSGPVPAPVPIPEPPLSAFSAGSGADRKPIRLVRHSRLVLRLRWRLSALQGLFDEGAFWARQRPLTELRRMLSGSQVVVSAWQGNDLVGFGRASSDGVYRAVLWDVVVAARHQGQGLGRRLVEALLISPRLARVERVYLMTTNSAAFYERLGFHEGHGQHLMVRSAAGVGAIQEHGGDGTASGSSPECRPGLV